MSLKQCCDFKKYFLFLNNRWERDDTEISLPVLVTLAKELSKELAEVMIKSEINSIRLIIGNLKSLTVESES